MDAKSIRMTHRVPRSAASDRMRDEILQQVVTEGIENDPVLRITSREDKRKVMIVVDVVDGCVTLSGIVRSAAERRRAVILAWAFGAASVQNKLDVEA